MLPQLVLNVHACRRLNATILVGMLVVLVGALHSKGHRSGISNMQLRMHGALGRGSFLASGWLSHKVARKIAMKSSESLCLTITVRMGSFGYVSYAFVSSRSVMAGYLCVRHFRHAASNA